MEDMYICLCNAVRQSQIEKAIAEGVNTLELLKDTLEVAINCCQCEPDVIRILDLKVLK